MRKKIFGKIIGFVGALLLLTGSMLYLPQTTLEAKADTTMITVPFITGSVINVWDFPYSDEYFKNSGAGYDPELTKASLGLAISAFRNDGKDLDNQYETYLSGAGFTDIHAFGYDKETAKDTLSGVIAHKQIGDFTLIAAAGCGQGYKNEWAGNLMVGIGERHEGFRLAADILEGQIWDYIEEHQITGKIKLWLGGFSRAAAVANLTAADMIESGKFDQVYAYLFGTPRTTKNPVEYQGIYNICGAFDPVPDFPLETWGFGRYGTDLFTPAQETTSAYTSLKPAAEEIYEKLSGDPLKNSPLINYRVHLLIEFLADMFPTQNDYAEELQQIVIETWTDPEAENIAEILIGVVSKLEDLDARRAAATETFIDYMTLIASEHLNGEMELDEEHWYSDLSKGYNYLREHLPTTYLSWIFSDNTPETLYYGPGTTRRLVVMGDVDVLVRSKDGELISSVLQDGDTFQENRYRDDEAVTEVFLRKSGSQIIVMLPMDEEYQVLFYTEHFGSISYYQAISSTEKLMSGNTTLYSVILHEGTYELKLDQGEQLMPLTALSGRVVETEQSRFKYSPTAMMAPESGTKKHITLGWVLQFGFFAFAGIVLYLFVCLLIFIIHAIRRKKRARPYSNGYVVVPHLILICFFAVMTQFCTLNLYTIGMAKTSCATMTGLLIFFLSLRGLIRSFRPVRKGYITPDKGKKVYCIIFSAVILLLTVLTFLLFAKSPLGSYSAAKCIIYYALVTVLTVLACLTFPARPKKVKKQQPQAA